MSRTADVVICGAGMAGVAAAYHLAVRHRLGRVLVIDEREPFTLTSDKGTQGYRNWWPGPDATMLSYMTRSIDVMEEIAEESGNVFRLNRRGYLFVSADGTSMEQLQTTAQTVSSFGMGPVRIHPGPIAYTAAPADGYRDLPMGADLLLGSHARQAFPYLAEGIKGALHVRRAGWMNGVAMGLWMLKRALGAGATFVKDRMTEVLVDGAQVRGIRTASGETIHTDRVVLATGPLLGESGQMLGIEIPVHHELHAKATLRDIHGAVPRDAPFIIWNDPTTLLWTDEERERLAAHAESRHLLGLLPAGVHVRPVDGPHGDELYLIWTYHSKACAAVWPPVFDPHYWPVVARGAAQMIPAISAYLGAQPTGVVDGGYYCKTVENRPLIGPLPVEGAYVLGALSGYGLMGAHAGADLLAAHVTRAPLPDYARWFHPARYDDVAYRDLVKGWVPSLANSEPEGGGSIVLTA